MGLQEEILAALAGGEALSGAALGARLGVSRNSVWKAVQRLRQGGYPILGTPNRGYRLLPGGNQLSAALVASHFPGSGWDIQVYGALDSTNTQAKRLAAEGFSRPTAVIADCQEAGRGRLGRTFVSPAGTGLYLSLLFRPRGAAQDAVRGTTFAAVAVARALERFCPGPVEIKWVNDLYLHGRKICGILTEAGVDVETGGLSYMVIGIGVNVGHAVFPPALRDVAGTVEDLTGVRVDRARLAAAIMEEMGDVEAGFPRGYMDEYRRRSLILGKQVTVVTGDDRYDAVAVAIDDDAALLVEAEGIRRRVAAGEVSIRNWRAREGETK